MIDQRWLCLSWCVGVIATTVTAQSTTDAPVEITQDWSICVVTKTLEEIRLDTKATTCVDLAPYCDDLVHGHYILDICPTVCEICLNPPEDAGWTVKPEVVDSESTPDEFELNTATAAALFALGMVVFVVLGYCTYTLISNRCRPPPEVNKQKVFEADWDDEYFEFGKPKKTGEMSPISEGETPVPQSPGYELNPLSPENALSPVEHRDFMGVGLSKQNPLHDGLAEDDIGDGVESEVSQVEQLRSELLKQMRSHEESAAVWSVDSPIPEGMTPEEHYLTILAGKGLSPSIHSPSVEHDTIVQQRTKSRSPEHTDLDAEEGAEPKRASVISSRGGSAKSHKAMLQRQASQMSQQQRSNKQLRIENSSRNSTHSNRSLRSPPGKWKEQLAAQQNLLNQSVAKGNADMQSAKSQITHLSTQMEILAAQRSTLADGVNELQEKLKFANHQNSTLSAQNSSLSAYHSRQHQHKQAQKMVTQALMGELKLLRVEHQSLRKVVAQDMFPDMVSALQSTTDHLVGKSESVIEDATRDLMARYRYEARQRKILYNHIQELKGNVRVFCRVRRDTSCNCVMTFPDSKGVGTPTELTCPQPNDENIVKRFEFDRVFNPADDQEAVFDDTEPLITSCVDGYNVAIIAYGQTGSGKTYTMMGTPDNPGVNRRAIQELLRVCSERDAVDYTMSVSLLEIYNDSITDLVSDVPANKQDNPIRMDPKTKRSFVPSLIWRDVASEADIVKVINDGEKNRTVAFTKMNSASSRSHLMLSITITGVDAVSGQETKGKLTMVDLAGSERIAKSEVSGKELAEAVAINKSLSCLGQVFVGLQTNQTHIPYRNSKLTHILQESLGGDAKACVFINISPSRTNLQETLSTLQFGSDIRKIEIRSGGKGGGSNPGTPTARRKSSMVPPNASNTNSPGRRASTAPHMDTPGRKMSTVVDLSPASGRKHSIA